MGLPSKKRTKQSKRERAAHFALKSTGLNACPKCKKPVKPHYACKNCGTYKGREVVKVKTKKGTKTAKK